MQKVFLQNTFYVLSKYYETGFFLFFVCFHQVLITEDFLQRLDKDLDDLTRPSEVLVIYPKMIIIVNKVDKPIVSMMFVAHYFCARTSAITTKNLIQLELFPY